MSAVDSRMSAAQSIDRVREALVASRQVPNTPLGVGLQIKDGVTLWLDDVLVLLLAYDDLTGRNDRGRLILGARP